MESKYGGYSGIDGEEVEEAGETFHKENSIDLEQMSGKTAYDDPNYAFAATGNAQESDSKLPITGYEDPNSIVVNEEDCDSELPTGLYKDSYATFEGGETQNPLTYGATSQYNSYDDVSKYNYEVNEPNASSDHNAHPKPDFQAKPNLERNWSQELAYYKSSNNYAKLSDLYEDFVEVSTHIGKTIIMEKHLPVRQKTIKPVVLGGVAGGEKFTYCSILFKFPTDVLLGSGQYLYGGLSPNVACANKAAGHELKSLDAFETASATSFGTDYFQFPLMCLIDFRGHRLIALTFLPIDKNTLALGSNDGGLSCLNRVPELYQRTCNVCDVLGLAKHDVCGVEMPGPGDLECHMGKDNKYYVVDFARLFPPDIPEKASKTIFYQLLRPELVSSWGGEKISSDAFSNWGRTDKRAKEMNDVARMAARYMRTTAAENCANSIQGILGPEEKVSFGVLSDLFYNLSGVLHKHGKNYEHNFFV